MILDKRSVDLWLRSEVVENDPKLIARHGSLDGYFDISRINFDIDKSLTFLVICY